MYGLAIPVFRSAASSVGKQALATGTDIAKDYLNGRPIRETVESRSREGLAELADRAGKAVRQNGRGLGFRPKKSIDGPEADIFHNPKRSNKVKRHVAR